MSKIEYEGRGELYITDITKARTMDKSGIDRAITVCQDSIEDNISDEVVYSHYNMSDGPADDEFGGSCEYELFESAADELYEALSAGETVLIHCHAGVSRSVSVSTAALGRLLGEPRVEAIGIVHSYRDAFAYPDDLLMAHAKRYIES